MEILIFLFVIGIALMIIFQIGAVILGPILVAGGTIGVFIAGIFAAIFGFFRLLGSGLGKLSEIETGKTKQEQLNELEKKHQRNKNAKKKSNDDKWDEIVGENNKVFEVKEKTERKVPNNSFLFEEETESSAPSMVNSDGKLPSGFFDGV